MANEFILDINLKIGLNWLAVYQITENISNIEDPGMQTFEIKDPSMPSVELQNASMPIVELRYSKILNLQLTHFLHLKHS